MKWIRYVVSLLCAGALCACALKGAPASEPVQLPPRIVDNSCTIWRPIFFSKTDVIADSTAQEVVDHNCRGVNKCGWKLPGLDCSKSK